MIPWMSLRDALLKKSSKNEIGEKGESCRLVTLVALLGVFPVRFIFLAAIREACD